MSFGAPGVLLAATRAYLSRLYARGDMLFLAAAGNDGDDRLAFPAGYPEVVSVAATGPDNRPTNFSNYNSDVELAAPGSNILSTLARRDGTSHVGGASLAVSPPLPPGAASLTQPPASPFSGSGTGAERRWGLRCLLTPRPAHHLPAAPAADARDGSAALLGSSINPSVCPHPQARWRRRWRPAAWPSPPAETPAGCASSDGAPTASAKRWPTAWPAAGSRP